MSFVKTTVAAKQLGIPYHRLIYLTRTVIEPPSRDSSGDFPIKKIIVDEMADIMEAMDGVIVLLKALIQAFLEWKKDNEMLVNILKGGLLGVTGVGGLVTVIDILRQVAKNTGQDEKDVDVETYLNSLYDTKFADNNLLSSAPQEELPMPLNPVMG